MTKILLAVTGASGQIYAARMAQIIKTLILKENNHVTTATSPTINTATSPTVNTATSPTINTATSPTINTATSPTINTAIANKLPENKSLNLEMVFTDTAKIVWHDELNYGNPNGPYPLPTNLLDNNSYYHSYASGSNAADVMIIIPCTMGTIGRISSGATTDLISRAADVMLKERRTLVIVPRENPFNLIHLRNLTTLAEAGAIIAPASPSFYTHPQDLEALIDTLARRILNIAGIPVPQPRFE